MMDIFVSFLSDYPSKWWISKVIRIYKLLKVKKILSLNKNIYHFNLFLYYFFFIIFFYSFFFIFFWTGTQYEICTHIFRLQSGCITIMQTRCSKVNDNFDFGKQWHHTRSGWHNKLWRTCHPLRKLFTYCGILSYRRGIWCTR